MVVGRCCSRLIDLKIFSGGGGLGEGLSCEMLGAQFQRKQYSSL